jgi:adenylate cyclase
VEELLDRSGQLALGGERRPVCILFADMRGFTPFAESHTAEEVIAVINRYTTAMTGALLTHGGILDRYTGDGFVARFDIEGSPHDEVCRAVAAALAISDTSETVAAELTAEGRHALRVGIGLHYGEAVVGLVGSPTQFHYTAMGHSVVVAARLQGLAQGGEILITKDVYDLVSEAFECTATEPIWLKGMSEPVQTYRVIQSVGDPPA